VAVRTSYTDQKKNYLLVKDHTVFHPFPWKGWALLSIGSPLGLFFLAVLIAKAYYQIVDHNEVPEENINDGSNWIMALNTLNKVNVVWLMLVVIVVLFTVWYIPEAIKYMGSITGEWIERYWVFPSVVLGVLLMVFLLWMLLQYKLKSKALNIEVEKFKYMQLEQQTKTLLLQEGPRDSQTDEKDEKDE